MARAFVEIVAEGDTAVPELDFAAACPETEVYWVGGLEHEAESGDVNRASHKLYASIKYYSQKEMVWELAKRNLRVRSDSNSSRYFSILAKNATMARLNSAFVR